MEPFLLSAGAIFCFLCRSVNKLWRSGIIFSAAAFVAGLGNYAFQGLIGRLLDKAEFGYVNSALAFVDFLSLPLLIATTAVTHYIAHFHASGDDARLIGLLAGCRKFLFRLTVAGSLLAVLLVKPLGAYFEIPRASLTLAALICVLLALWGSFVTAICQGLGWFKRLALIGLLMAALRLACGWMAGSQRPTAEVEVLATAVALLANLVLLFWRKDLAHKGTPASPYNREFAQFVVVAAACTLGSFCFTKGDILACSRNFQPTDKGLYTAANKLGGALPMTVAPMLAVLFTSRSGQRGASALREQLRLLGLYAVGLAFGATVLLAMRGFFVKVIFGKDTPETAEMLVPLAFTMAFVGLMQALATWSLASRWFKLSVLYGVAGVSYWFVLIHWGKSPGEMLRLMPPIAGAAFALLLISWLITMKSTPHQRSE